MVEERCRTDHEKQKFFSYIDDLEKIVRLLLNLAGQLARAENAIQSLPENVDPKIRVIFLTSYKLCPCSL